MSARRIRRASGHQLVLPFQLELPVEAEPVDIVERHWLREERDDDWPELPAWEED